MRHPSASGSIKIAAAKPAANLVVYAIFILTPSAGFVKADCIFHGNVLYYKEKQARRT
jgi:hypothetical protein